MSKQKASNYNKSIADASTTDVSITKMAEQIGLGGAVLNRLGQGTPAERMASKDIFDESITQILPR